MLRRNFLKIIAGVLLSATFPFGRKARATGYAFAHGVASGDPLDDRVILWTRVSGGSGETVDVSWRVATDPDMQSIVARGSHTTGPDRDYTVKVDAAGLPSGSTLFYRFEVDGVQSAIGRTRTLPVGEIDSARFAVVSCSNYPAGFFFVYRDIAARDDIDAVLHLGDYLYEYGQGEYATQMAEQLGRVPDPPVEIVSLDDYRRRHAQYKSDPDSQAMLARHPLIAVWDDHEVTNDAWRDGAQNHGNSETVDEGSWPARKAAGMRAYFEWMPIRGELDRERPRIYRNFRYGNLLDLMMLDTRFYGRDMQPDISETDLSREAILGVINGEKRQMLGRRQERWLRRRLKRSRATWQVIGQQVLVADMDPPNLEPLLDPEKPSPVPPEELQPLLAMSRTNAPVLLDTWTGYRWARQRLLRDVARHGRNTVFLSGDLHTPTAADIYEDGGNRPVAVEFMPSSVTSPGFADYLPEREPGSLPAAVMQQNPHIRYMQTGRRGWLCMTFTGERCLGEWHHVDSIYRPDYSSQVDRRLTVDAGRIGAGLQDA